MNYKMINDYVLVRLKETVKVRSSGIILSSNTVEPPCVGTVLSVGPGKFHDSGILEEHDIQIGDVIVFGKSSLNTPLKDEDTEETLYVMKVSEVFGKKRNAQ